MFSFAGTTSPSRSESVMSGAGSTWTSSTANSPQRDAAWAAASQSGSPTGSCASYRTNSSAASAGVKSRQIRDLRLEIELKDARITELEAAYEELERRAAFQQGETKCKLAEYEREVGAMAAEQGALKATIAEQNAKLEEVNRTMSEMQSMHLSFKAMLARCAELEESQRRREVEEAEAKRREAEEAEAKRAAEKAAAEKAEAERKAAEEAAAAVAAAAAEAERIALEERLAALGGGGRPLPCKAPAAAPAGRPQSAGPGARNAGGNQQARGGGQQTRRSNNDCAMM